jgi:uncharacterized protein (DUF2384 family)
MSGTGGIEGMPLRNLLRYRAVACDSARRDTILKLLVEFFGSTKKAELWLEARNPLLGGVTPKYLISIGRSDKLLKFVRQCLEENKP